MPYIKIFIFSLFTFLASCSEPQKTYDKPSLKTQLLSTPLIKNLPFLPVDLKIIEAKESDGVLKVTANFIYRTTQKEIEAFKKESASKGVSGEMSSGFALRQFVENSFQVNKSKIITYRTLTNEFEYSIEQEKWLLLKEKQ